MNVRMQFLICLSH